MAARVLGQGERRARRSSARLAATGLDANVVSRGEWAAARAAGVPNARITLEGIGKSAADLRAAVRAAADGHPLRWVAVESPEELDGAGAIAARAGLAARDGRAAARRPAPAQPGRRRPETHAELAVGRGSAKFGMTETELTGALALAARGRAAAGARRSTSTSGRSWAPSTPGGTRSGAALALLALVGRAGPGFDTLDVGGGFPVGDPGTVPTARPVRRGGRRRCSTALPADRRPARLAVEPGRFLVARAGWIVASVLHVRERADGERDRRARRGHDRADPAGAVRRASTRSWR